MIPCQLAGGLLKLRPRELSESLSSSRAFDSTEPLLTQLPHPVSPFPQCCLSFCHPGLPPHVSLPFPSPGLHTQLFINPITISSQCLSCPPPP